MEVHYFFACPEREGQHIFYTIKRWVTINFTASWRGSHFLTPNIKGGPGDFTFMLIGIPPAHPPVLKNECSLRF